MNPIKWSSQIVIFNDYFGRGKRPWGLPALYKHWSKSSKRVYFNVNEMAYATFFEDSQFNSHCEFGQSLIRVHFVFHEFILCGLWNCEVDGWHG